MGGEASPAESVSLEQVLAIATRTAGDNVDADVPLMEAGIDSLGAVELRNKLQQAVGNSERLSSTIIFDHPTVRQLALALKPKGAPTASPVASSSDTPRSSSKLATVVGLAALLADLRQPHLARHDGG